MKFLDLFAGIGGFRLGLERQGHECVGFCEIDKFARKSYKAMYETEGDRISRQIKSQTKILDNLEASDTCGDSLLLYLFLRSTRTIDLRILEVLFFEIARAAKTVLTSQPRFILKNVISITSESHLRHKE